jgi:hypothetical protein
LDSYSIYALCVCDLVASSNEKFLFLSVFQGGMFDGATDFNQSLSGWNVMGATSIVSLERSFGFVFNMHYACDLIECSNEYRFFFFVS